MGNFAQYPVQGNVPTYSSQSALPGTANDGSLAVTLDTDSLYVFNASGSNWVLIGPVTASLSMGTFDAAASSANGGVIGSNSLFLQSATANNPGLVSSASQTFSGTKTFSSAPIFTSLTSNLPAAIGSGFIFQSRSLLFGSPDVIGSVSLTGQVSGNLPLSQTQGSLSLTNRVSGNLPLSQTSGSLSLVNQVVGSLPLSQTTGSISLTNQVSGNLPLAQTSGSISLTTQVSGNLPLSQTQGSLSLTTQVVNNLPLSQTSGSISLTAQVSGNLPLSQTQGSISLTAQVSGILPQGNIPTTLNMGSVTMTSSAGGASYTVRWPGAQGSSTAQYLKNDGAGNLSWEEPTLNIVNTSGNYTITANDGVILCGSGTGFIVLTNAVGLLPGKEFEIVNKLTSTTFDPITIMTASSQTFSLGSGILTTINSVNESLRLRVVSSQGYMIVNRRIPSNEITTIAFAPPSAGYGVVTSTSYICYRSGRYLNARLTFTAGSSTGASTANILLPSYLTVETANVQAGLHTAIGTWAVAEAAAAGTNYYPNLSGLVGINPSQTDRIFVSLKGAAGVMQDTNVNSISGGSGSVTFFVNCSIPISGWKEL